MPPETARERLIEAAADQLWENGYTATSPADIQRAAGVGQGSMYHHFAGKVGLAAAAIERLAAGLGASVQEVLTGPGSGRERLIGYLERQREPLRGCRIGRLTADPDVLEQPALRAGVHKALDELRIGLAGAVRDAQAEGGIDPALDPEAVATAIAAVVQGGYVLARADQDPRAFDLAIAGLRALLLRADVPPSPSTQATQE